LESLEDRWLPSAVNTISWNDGQPCSDVYAINANTHQVIDIHTDGNTGAMTYNMLGGPTNVTAVNASFLPYDHQNKPIVYALSADSSAWVYVPDAVTGKYHWDNLGTGFTALSATQDGFVFGLNQNGQVMSNNAYGLPSQWNNLGTPGVPIKAISASQDGSGIEEVFALGADGHIYLDRFDANYNPIGWTVVDSSKTYTQISANDHNTVYGLDSAGQITQESEYNFWLHGHHLDYWSGQQLASPQIWTPWGTFSDSFTQISAGTDKSGNNVVYGIDGFYAQPYVFNAQGQWQRMDGSHPSEIAAGDGGWYYDVDSKYHDLNQYDPAYNGGQGAYWTIYFNPVV
jgi:hypothetical protein